MKRLFLIACLLLTAGAACPADTAEDAPQTTAPERITGRLVDTSFGAGTAHFTLQIDKLSTDEEMAILRAMLKEMGEEETHRVMGGMTMIGWLRIAGSIRYTVPVIDSIPTADGGRIIRVITPRSLADEEVMESSRSRKYRFILIELVLGPDGTGEGVALGAARFTVDEQGDLQIESYGTNPIKIFNVKSKAGD